jgi:RNA polymerase sigma factor (sigma-70 family)
LTNLVTKLIKPVPIEKFSEEELLKGLEHGGGKIISFIYKRNMGAIRNMVKQYSIMVLGADDVIQEGLTRTIMNIRDKKFKGTSSIHTYLYSVCKNICLKEFEKSKMFYTASVGMDLIEEQQNDYYDLLQAVIKIKGQLEQKCVEIIDLRFSMPSVSTLNQIPKGQENPTMMPFEEIALKLDILPDNARQRFKRCLEKLIMAVKKEKLIDEFF